MIAFGVSTLAASWLWLLLSYTAPVSSNSAGVTSSSGSADTWSVPLLSARHVWQRKLEEQQQQRRAAGVTGTTDLQVSQLYQGYGTHYVDLWVGTPIPQRQTVIVDTGSSVTAFPCKGCNECGFDDKAEYHTDTYFDPSLSKTFTPLSCNECRMGSCNSHLDQCSISMSYAEGSSWNAYAATDFLYAGGSHSEPISPIDPLSAADGGKDNAAKFEVEYTFGCQTRLTGLFRTQLADGIMGMSNERNAFWDQVYRSGRVTKKQFSLCFSRQDFVDPNGTPAGAMTIGGYDSRLHSSPMVFAKEISRGQGFYTVRLKNIYLKQSSTDKEMIALHFKESQLNSRGVIVDSGTTDTYFMSVVAGPFQKAWKEMTGKAFSNNAMQFESKEDILALPTVVLQLEGASKEYYESIYGSVPTSSASMLTGETLDPAAPYDVLVSIPPSHYMEYDPNADKYTPRLYMDEHSGTVLGANTMQGHDVLFDMDNGYIGFAESDCNIASALKEKPSVPITTTSSKAEIVGNVTDVVEDVPTMDDVPEELSFPSEENNKEPITAETLSDPLLGDSKQPVDSEIVLEYFDDMAEEEELEEELEEYYEESGNFTKEYYEEYYEELGNLTLSDDETPLLSQNSDTETQSSELDVPEDDSEAMAQWYFLLAAVVAVGIVSGGIILYRRSRANSQSRGGRMPVPKNELEFYDDDELEGVEIMSSRTGR
eukprot:CAMPEP_0172434606 /NCGR_PEP_ID=MMETSP1064-20121228/70721_1 /TAXON_ID=202472 /ORGANISM="Aulacoseira subarctica , Strain CCAP 1002/5" /LENGTH=708 /DNA_ID=CAMNT_0013182839 /DNA_START=428 /DNA_END=2551 /DNA_ORIENTATION=-